MSESIRRMLLEQSRLQALMDPYKSLRDHLGSESAVHQALGIHSAQMAALNSEQELVKRLADVSSGWYSSAFQAAQEEMRRHSNPTLSSIEEAKRFKLLDHGLDVPQSLAAALKAQQTYERDFRLPTASEVTKLASLESERDSVRRMLAGSGISIEGAMAGMHSPWLRDIHSAASARGFAELVGIGAGIQGNNPFDADFAAALRPALGDWRDQVMQPLELVDPVLRVGFYRARGLDPALTDFPAAAFQETLRISGLQEVAPEVSETGATDASEDEQDNASKAFAQLRELETSLRRFLAHRLKAKYGDQWMKHQLPGKMLQSWQDKKAKDAGSGLDLPLIDYADFSDYAMIIERGDNWRDVFAPIFGRKEDIQESFRRLGPLRIATMHSRQVVQEDLLLLVVESNRVLKAIRIAGEAP